MTPVRALFLLTPVVAAAEPRVDRHGDALPAGAVARLGTTRLRHGGAVNCVAFSSDGRLLASGGDDRLVRLWEPTTGREVGRLEGPGGAIVNLAFTPSGRGLLTADDNGSLRFWDVHGGEELWRDGGDNPSPSFVLTPDGRSFLIPTGDHTASISLRELGTGREINRFDADFPITALAISRDGAVLAAAGAEGTIALWQLHSGAELHRIRSSEQRVPAIAFSPDGKRLASCGRDDRLVFWDVQTGKETHEGDEKLYFGNEVAFSADGKTLATGCGWFGGEVRLWDVRTCKSLRVLAQHPRGVGNLRFSPDGKTLAVTFIGDHAVRLWDWSAGREFGIGAGPVAPIIAVAVASGARSAATVDAHSLRQWDGRKAAAVGDPINSPGSFFDDALFAPDGRGALVRIGRLKRHTDASVLWIEPAAQKVGDQLSREVGSTALALSAHDTIYADGNAFGIVVVNDLPSGERRRQFGSWEAHRPPVTALAFTPDDRLLAVAHRGGDVLLWNVGTGRLLFVRNFSADVRQMLFSPDGRTLVLLAETEVALVETATWQRRGVLKPPAATATAVAWALSGRALVAGGSDGSLWAWDVLTGRPALPRRAHEGPVRALAFSPDGKLLISGAADTTALIWDVASLGL
jgi:WD40 repeat protein